MRTASSSIDADELVVPDVCKVGIRFLDALFFCAWKIPASPAGKLCEVAGSCSGKCQVIIVQGYLIRSLSHSATSSDALTIFLFRSEIERARAQRPQLHARR